MFVSPSESERQGRSRDAGRRQRTSLLVAEAARRNVPSPFSRPVRGVACVQVVHLVDGANEMVVFREAVALLEELIAAHGRVVVHCRAGLSRSPAVVAAYLKNAQNLEAKEALAFVKARRESTIVPELVELVERY